MPFTDCTPPMQKFSKIEFLNREPLLVYGSPKRDDGGGLIFRVVSNSLDIYTIGFTSKYSFMDDMNKNVFMPCIITGMNFRKFSKVDDTEKVPCPNWIVAIVVKCDLR